MQASYNKIEKQVLEVLASKLPKYFTYHSVEHTKYVLKKAIYIASKENVSKHELFLLKVAALYHDIGFTKTHIEHEKIGCGIARKELPKYDISQNDLDIICGMIMATKIPQQPKTKLENILADADLEYLGTKHFYSVSELLYTELKHFNKELTRDDWNHIQDKFITNHNYHTAYCKRYKEHRKLKNLKSLFENDKNK